MDKEDAIRQEVTDAYARAVERPACCGTAPKGVAAKLAGYDAETLGALPADAVTNSFGCGNPLAFSAVAPGEVVLDLGCGAGLDMFVAAKRVGPTGRVIGVDMTDEMIARANSNIAESGLDNIEARKGLIEQLPVDDASVDWVVSNCVINLSPEKPKVFAEIARVLKPGGRMTVADIVVRELPDWVREHKALYCSCVAGAISEDDYLAGLRNAGLVDVTVQERLVYDGPQVGAFIESELQGDGEGCCNIPGATPDELRRMADTLQGHVWSARIFARRP